LTPSPRAAREWLQPHRPEELEVPRRDGGAHDVVLAFGEPDELQRRNRRIDRSAGTSSRRTSWLSGSPVAGGSTTISSNTNFCARYFEFLWPM